MAGARWLVVGVGLSCPSLRHENIVVQVPNGCTDVRYHDRSSPSIMLLWWFYVVVRDITAV